MNDINTDFYMTTEHRRKEKKGRVKFSMVMNKVLIGTIVLTSLISPLSTAYATSSKGTPTKSNVTVEMQYEQSIDNVVYKLDNTISQLEHLRESENRVSKSLLTELATGLLELESAIRTSGKTATEDIFALIERAEATLESVPKSEPTAIQARKAIDKIKQSLEIATIIEEDNHKNQAVSLTDINNHWGKTYIDKLVNRGGISGYPDGTFKPNNPITKAEFIAIAVRSALDGKVKSQIPGGHWVSGIIEDAREKQVLLMYDFPDTELDKPINRYEMAYVMVRVTENILKEEKVNTSGVAKIMSDYSQVSQQSKYKYYVEQAFMKGLVTGKTADGKYDGNANGTRAEAATMVVRMLETPIRVEVDVDKPSPIVEGREISLTDPSRPLVPREGDTIIKRDGTKVVLKVGPSGVLGEGQGVDYYTGIVHQATGIMVKHGSIGTQSMGYRGQTYLVDTKTGEGHFALDWNAIRNHYGVEAQDTIKNPKPGQKHGIWYEYDGKYWTWLGPINQ